MRLAAIEVGTTSVHLVVADVGPDGALRRLTSARERVDLGRGIGADRRLPGDGVARALAALGRFRAACDAYAVDAITTAATSAVRDATDGDAFRARVAAEAGFDLRVISGAEEARLVWLGVRDDVDFARGPALLADLGGGSLELAVGGPREVLVAHSLPLGHLRLAEAHARTDPPTAEALGRVREEVRARLAPIASTLRAATGPFVGASGPIRRLARMAWLADGLPARPHDHGLVLARADLAALLGRFTSLDALGLLALPGMDERRRVTLPIAAVVLDELLEALGRDRLVTSDRGLRDGLLLDWLARHRPDLRPPELADGPRARAVHDLMARCAVDRAHASRVERLALELFDGLAPLHGLPPEARALLGAAALLHDVGHHVDGRDHPEHGAYLVRHARMAGFTALEHEALATLVRHHQGGRPTRAELPALARADRERVRTLAALLALADALDRGHAGAVEAVRVRLDPDEARIEALARAGAGLERWAAGARVGALAEVLGRPVRLDVVPSATESAFRPAAADQVE